MNRKKKLRLGLHHFYPAAKYAGALFTALAWGYLPETVWLWGDVFSSRRFLLLWAAALLLLGLWLDRSRRAAREKDAAEIKASVKYGGLNESTLLALSVPLMFILDALAVLHLYLSYFKSGAPSAADPADALLPAAGMVLFIYGRALPQIPYRSIWGIATKDARKSEAAWKQRHRAVSLPVTLLGALALALGAFVQGPAAIAACVLVCAGAFLAMFLPRKV